jgi:ATP-dependent Clp protease ATP-binding subunit ClpA
VTETRLAHLRGLEGHLRAAIRGQDHLVPVIASAFCRAALGLSTSERPRASLLLVGPTGTGKSEIFALATTYVYGADRLLTFDMSEYQHESAVNKLLGENHADPGLLGRALLTAPNGGILFDEIEKAHPRVLDLFLQLLWRGMITVATGQTFRMGDYVLGFTSNIGAVESMRMAYSRFPAIEQATLRRVEQTLRPELIGRFDEKLVFARLNSDVQREICALEVARETARLRGAGYDLEVSSEALEFLVREGFHPHLGARSVRKTVERYLQNAVMQHVFATGSGSGNVVPDRARSRLIFESLA